MADHEVTIKIGTDAKNVTVGVGVAKGEIAGLAPILKQLSASFDSLAKDIRTAMAQGAASTKEMDNGLKSVGAKAISTSGAVGGLAKAAHEGGHGFNLLKTVLQSIPGPGKIIAFAEKTAEWTASNSKATQSGAMLADSIAAGTAAFTGLEQVLAGALASTIAGMVNDFTRLTKATTDSFTSGGFVREIFDSVVFVLRGLREVVVSGADAFGQMFKQTGLGSANWRGIIQTAVDAVVWVLKALIWVHVTLAEIAVETFFRMQAKILEWKGYFVTTFDEVSGAVNILLADFKVFATVAYDALTMQWSRVKTDWQTGMDHVNAVVREAGAKIVADAARIGREAGTAMANAMRTRSDFDSWSKQFWQKHEASEYPSVGEAKKNGESPPQSGSGGDQSDSSRHRKIQNTESTYAPNFVVGAADKPLTIARTISDDLVNLVTQTNAKLKAADNAALEARKAKWKGVADSIASAWGQSLQGMIKGTQNFRGMMLNIGNAILGEATKWIEKKASKFIAKELAQTAATTVGVTTRTGVEATGAATSAGISATSALTQIGHSAAVAAAGAYAAIVKIAYVGPILAPLAAAAALAGVMALGKSIFSAEGGMGQVPYDGAMFELHKDEMVLPASLATPMRSMLLGSSATSVIGASANDAAITHNHHYNINAMDGQDVHRVLMRHHQSVGRAVEKAYRNGFAPGR